MLGVWNCNISMGEHTLNANIYVEDIAGITISVATDPIPLFETLQVNAEDNHIKAICKSLYTQVSTEPVIFDLYFDEESFNGTLTMSGMEIPIQGNKGKMVVIDDSLIEEVKAYHKENTKPRSDEDIAQAVEDLLTRMSVEEKIGQMCQCLASNYSFGGSVESDPPEKQVAEGRTGSILGAFDINRVFELQKIAVTESRLGIPLFFNNDIIHGHQTIFPIPLAWSCSWDMEGIKKACAIAAKEATASGINYNHGPMVDITRDARWGRVMEGAGEDPYLGSMIAKAQVEGFQGNDLFSDETLIACLKHFVAYGASEGGRDYNTVDISEGTLRNFYLKPFKAGIEAGAGSVMNAFNIYQGVPVAGNEFLLKKVLRDELGFEGMTISDYGAVEEIKIHGCAKDNKAAAKMAVDATLDIEMVTQVYANELPRLLEKGEIKEEQINNAVRRILTYKYKIGLMDDPFRYIHPEKESVVQFCEEHLNHSRELAKKSVVLLKNNDVLPITKDKKIALIGPFATSKDLLGAWNFTKYTNEVATIYQGLREKGFEKNQIIYEKGCKVDEAIEGGIEKAIEAAKAADIVLLTLGESSKMSGESTSRAHITIPDVQVKLAKAISELKKPTILLLTNGRPLELEWFDQNMDAIVETWFLGSQAGNAIADVLVGDYNPSGKLTMSFPYCVGQEPLYYNHFNTGRPYDKVNGPHEFVSRYLDTPNEPLYPFGYGLSYTEFEYSNLVLERDVLLKGEQLKVSVTVKNTGNRSGIETVQLYVQDLYGSTVRPVRELKGFEQVQLSSGESKNVTFVLKEEDLSFFTAKQVEEAEIGEFKVYVGGNCVETLEASFTLVDDSIK